MKNIFSLSFKCEIVKILHRAFRSQNRILAISKHSPLHHALNVGFAKRRLISSQKPCVFLAEKMNLILKRRFFQMVD